MFKKLLLISFLFSLIGVIYPAKKENTKLFDFCYSFEKILSRNAVKKSINIPENVKSNSEYITKFVITNTRGALINKMISKYKTSKNSPIINLVPNQIYCFAGYWIERINPGTFESILYSKSKKSINEFKDMKKEFDVIIKDINSEYKVIKKEFNILF